MAVEAITMTTVGTKGGELVEVVDWVERAAKALPVVLAQLDAHSSDNGDGSFDRSVMETRYGIPTGQGQAVYDAIYNLNAALNGAGATNVQHAIKILG